MPLDEQPAYSVREGETKGKCRCWFVFSLFTSKFIIQNSIFNILRFIWYAPVKGYICRSNNLIR